MSLLLVVDWSVKYKAKNKAIVKFLNSLINRDYIKRSNAYYYAGFA